MRDITNLDDSNSAMPSSNSGRLIEIIALTELYLFCAGIIAVAILLPVIMLIQGSWNWIYAIIGPISGVLFWHFPFQEFQERFKYAVRHIPD